MRYLAKAWSGKLILERINIFFLSHHKYVSASGGDMFHFANRRGTACSGIREHFSSMQKESAGIILITRVTWSVILMQLKSQKVN